MTRIAVVMSIFLAAACDVGEVPLNQNATDGGGGGTDTGGGGDGGNGCVTLRSPANPATNHSNGGGTHAGENCMRAGGCHGPQPGLGGAFTFSGTLYTSAAATAPKTGATIKMMVGANTIPVETDTAGNFHGTDALTFPASTLASGCPTVTHMVGQLVTGGGACNNCHIVGGTTSPMYLQ
ncbi:MAG: hypothetical protein JWO36_2445 [Myxococcales bacterium]|nr:hypothetical protein [Myxococcales bacterium]